MSARLGTGLGLNELPAQAIRGRPNLLTRPIDFDNATWSKTALNVTANIAAAPDGTMTAEKLVETTAVSTSHQAGQTLVVNVNSPYAFSVYLKAGERSRALIYFGKSGSPFTRLGALVNLSNGSISAANSGTPSLVTQRDLEPLANGWYRVRLAGIFDTTSTDGTVEVRLDNGSTTTYTGDGTSGLYVWGAKLEQGADATPFRP